MKGYLQNISKIAIENHDFRQVLYLYRSKGNR